MKLHHTVIASIFALSLTLAGCGGGGEGDSCNTDDNCGSGLICAHIAVCGPEALEDCPGVCGQPCELDEECESGNCGETIGGMRICQTSTAPLME
jgi:hypothetical protein